MVSLRSGASFPKQEEPTTEPAPPPQRAVLPTRLKKKATSRASACTSVRIKKEKGSSDPPASGSRKRKRPAASAAAVEDTNTLDCGVCFLPLKPPIFQCDVGHVVCSTCYDKLKATGKCHVCGGATGGFRRCHAMERLVESIHVPCPHAAHGCTARPAYYELDAHSQTCPHSLFHCPGEACGFAGYVDALLDHFAGAHGWPRATKVRIVKEYESHGVRLRDGFNFLLATRAATGRVYLFLLNVIQQPFGRAISVVHIRPSGGDGRSRPSSSEEIKFDLRYSQHHHHGISRSSGDQVVEYYQSSKFRVASSDLSNGLPSPDGRFQFVVLSSVLGGDNIWNTGAIEVRAQISIA
ncbi:unnamed protein product [Urochloa humidicola]